MKKMFSGFAQLVLGFTIAILLVVGGSVAASLYLVARLTALPPKPDFGEHSSQPAIAASPAPTPNPAAPAPNGSTPASPSPIPNPSPSPSPTPSPTPEPAGLYRARVVWPEGLVLRATPGYDAASVGGVAYEAEVTVLEERDAGAWQRVRTGAGDEGWVVGGNLVTVADGATP